MAVIGKNSTAITGTVTLKSAHDGVVSRWVVHFEAISGTYTPKGVITGTSGVTSAAITAVKRADGTTVTSITATGIYDIDAAGLDVTLEGGTSCTISATPILG